MPPATSQNATAEPSQSQKLQKISARQKKKPLSRISQCDIFHDLRLIENYHLAGDTIAIDEIAFPYLICLNQECDLERDFEEKEKPDQAPSEKRLIHLAFAPVFVFDQYLAGAHWDKIYQPIAGQKRDSSKIKLVVDNEIPRYHYLKFEESGVPEMIIDFKHFFTISRAYVYQNMDKRVCSIEDLFKEKISQRFSYFLSRIGLPT